jgi:5'(3')-deoxyribonucleotidase
MYCYLDMDGVLVDCVGGAIAAHDLKVPITSLAYDLPPQFGMTEESFWGVLGYDFWVNLNWTQEGQHLLTELERVCGNHIVLLTGITHGTDVPGVREGKADWVRKHLPAYKHRCFIGSPKVALASPNKLLIDDFDSNHENFLAAGGQSILVPRPWNKARPLTDMHGNFGITTVIEQVTEIWRP